MTIRISHPTGKIKGRIKLDGSKSISNRALIIQAICGKKIELSGLSTSHDTVTLMNMLKSNEMTLDAGHAGTSFRFCTAYSAIGKDHKIITGSKRMKQRPIGPLVDALNSIGAQIKYLENDGYPPLKIKPFKSKDYQKKVSIRSDVSSQYLSALLMIAPELPDGLELHLEGELVSMPYLKMTLDMMDYFGVSHDWTGNVIRVKNQTYKSKPFDIEADWSAASYYFSLAALSDKSTLRLSGLHENSMQGDAILPQQTSKIGLKSKWKNDHLLIRNKHGIKRNENPLLFDFTRCPDIAQTWAGLAAGARLKIQFTGLQTLVIKETNRIVAISQELQKIGCDFSVTKDTKDLPLSKQVFEVSGKPKFKGVVKFSTYKDHRMAMAFAPLSLLHPIEIEDHEVVKKSYPNFWKDLKKLGFVIKDVE